MSLCQEGRKMRVVTIKPQNLACNLVIYINPTPPPNFLFSFLSLSSFLLPKPTKPCDISQGFVEHPMNWDISNLFDISNKSQFYRSKKKEPHEFEVVRTSFLVRLLNLVRV